MSNKKLRVLLAEEYPGKASASLRALYPEERDELELTNVSSISTLIATLDVVNPEVIFLDLSLAHPEALDEVRRVHRSAPNVPLIVLANSSEKDCAVRSLALGAHDYLLKEFIDSPALGRVLNTALEHNTLEGLADLMRDPQTGLYTRDGFLTLADHAMKVARLKGSTLVLLCLRIENLETLRAEYGPSAVESSLTEAAKLLAVSFRQTDIVARLGESQFAALAVDAVEPSVPVLCQRLQKRIAMLSHNAGPWGPMELRMSARFWSPKEEITFPEFLDSVECELRSTPLIPAGRSETPDSVTQR